MKENGHLLASATTSTPRLSDEERKAKKREYDRNYHSVNKAARRAASRTYRIKNPEACKNTKLKGTYGISLEQKEELLSQQAGVCAICSTGTPTAKGWMVDHCHETKAVRGILCHHCNTGLGLFKDNPATLAAAITYLGK